jgi:hypothetical protein
LGQHGSSDGLLEVADDHLSHSFFGRLHINYMISGNRLNI